MNVNMEICPVCFFSEQKLAHKISGKVNFHYDCPVCGEYEITLQAYNYITQESEYKNELWKLSYWINNRQGKETVLITNDKLIEVINNVVMPNASEQADKLIIWLGNRLVSPEDNCRVQYSSIIPIIGARNKNGVKYIIDETVNEGVVSKGDQGDYVMIGLTFGGWRKYEKLKKSKAINTYKAFMAMQYNDDVLTDMYNKIKIAVEQTGFKLFLLDEVLQAGLIDNQLRVQIRNSRFVLADLTHDNHGAYWEAGYAEGLGRPVIYLCEKNKFDQLKTHFDTNHHTTIIWDQVKPQEAIVKLKATIRETMPFDAKMTDD